MYGSKEMRRRTDEVFMARPENPVVADGSVSRALDALRQVQDVYFFSALWNYVDLHLMLQLNKNSPTFRMYQNLEEPRKMFE
ncbi:hypothetical protein B9Z55_027954 [Caenorhabditis nigoni]|uniref:Uncharacterized protein n=1 Tax=Caenorhabditis nigoni TaxID=1611254 RepID=A0A2G5SDS2_9PELO|nr:hypothetical protein B9Z55_027954 [Caenorhabditis nigoni]